MTTPLYLSKRAPTDAPMDQFSWFARMRATAPVYAHPAHGALSVFGYEDVQRVLSDYASFSSERGGGQATADEHALATSLISTDPPRHRQLRNLVTQAFTPRAVAQLEPRISAIVEELLDHALAHSREIDFIEEFAVPLPVIVIAEMLGVPPERRTDFRRWSDVMVSNTGGAQMGVAQREMAAFFGEMIARRRAEPRDDLISHLITSEIDGERLNQVELIGFCMLLLIAGNETTTNLLGNAVLALDAHPGAWATLRERPLLAASAVEETLRYLSPVQSMFRVARAESRLSDVSVRPGQFIIAWIGSANRDPAQFPNPDVFDIERTPNRHLAFGHGIHFCLGAPLARLEGRVALEALARRASRLAVREGSDLQWAPSDIVYGVRRLPVTVTAA